VGPRRHHDLARGVGLLGGHGRGNAMRSLMPGPNSGLAERTCTRKGAMEKWAQRVGWPKKAPLSRGQKLQEAETTLTTSGSDIT
jgi:hypothetical protein